MSRERISLAGMWNRSIAGTIIDTVAVPSSIRPTGEYVLSRQFNWLPKNGMRVFLVTEGIMGLADFSLNDKPLGTAGPFVPYEFEVASDLLRRGLNEIAVRIQDTQIPFGPAPGRRYDGGLTRPIYLELRPATFIKSIHFQSSLSPVCADVTCRLTVDLDGKTPLFSLNWGTKPELQHTPHLTALVRLNLLLRTRGSGRLHGPMCTR